MSKRQQGTWEAKRVFVENNSADLAQRYQLPTSLRASKRLLVGRHEWIGLPQLSPHPWLAKTDTGARTSTIHATNIRIANDGVTVHFQTTQPDGTAIECHAPLARTKSIRNSTGDAQQRLIIRTRAVFCGGLQFEIELTLADRSHMKCPVLLGRRAMAGYFLVDPQSDYLLGNREDFLHQTTPSPS